jgi:lipid A 3-O-deacylase
MMRVRDAAAAALVAALFLVPTARADDPGALALGAGGYDFDHNQPAGEFRGEYRFSQGFYFIKPTIGTLVTTRASTYTYFGLRGDFVFADHYAVMPNAAFGFWSKGDGKNLGSWFEFKTGVEFAYRFDNAWRVGLAFDHISNAGFTRTNPGTENLLLMVSMPLGF